MKQGSRTRWISTIVHCARWSVRISFQLTLVQRDPVSFESFGKCFLGRWLGLESRTTKWLNFWVKSLLCGHFDDEICTSGGNGRGYLHQNLIPIRVAHSWHFSIAFPKILKICFMDQKSLKPTMMLPWCGCIKHRPHKGTQRCQNVPNSLFPRLSHSQSSVVTPSPIQYPQWRRVTSRIAIIDLRRATTTTTT